MVEPVTKAPPEDLNKYVNKVNNIDDYDFITFKSDHLLDIPPVIAKCANDYLSSSHVSLTAVEFFDITREEIFNYIDEGFPVIIWTTMYMTEPEFQSFTSTYNDVTYVWYFSEHCVLIKGYDITSNSFIINDPLIGEVSRDIDDFMEISDTIGNLAVVIY